MDDQLVDLLLRAELLVDQRQVCLELLDVLRLVEDVVLVQVTQLDLGHELGLLLCDGKALHQVRNNVLVLLRPADDADRLVDVEEDFGQTFEEVQLFRLPLVIVVQLADDAGPAPLDPLVEYLVDAEQLRVPVDQDGHVA